MFKSTDASLSSPSSEGVNFDYMKIGYTPDFHLTKAIFDLRAELQKPIIADSVNPMYGKKYTSIFQMMEVLQPLFNKYNLVFDSTFGWETACMGTEKQFGVISTLTWVGEGTTESKRVFFPADRVADAQQMGKLMTYARRYSLVAMLNLCFSADEDDDDGNSLKEVKKKAPKPLSAGPVAF